MFQFPWIFVGTFLLVLVLVVQSVGGLKQNSCRWWRPRQKAERSDEFPPRTIRNNLPDCCPPAENSRTLSLSSIGSSDPTHGSAKTLFKLSYTWQKKRLTGTFLLSSTSRSNWVVFSLISLAWITMSNIARELSFANIQFNYCVKILQILLFVAFQNNSCWQEDSDNMIMLILLNLVCFQGIHLYEYEDGHPKPTCDCSSRQAPAHCKQPTDSPPSSSSSPSKEAQATPCFQPPLAQASHPSITCAVVVIIQH